MEMIDNTPILDWRDIPYNEDQPPEERLHLIVPLVILVFESAFSCKPGTSALNLKNSPLYGPMIQYLPDGIITGCGFMGNDVDFAEYIVVPEYNALAMKFHSKIASKAPFEFMIVLSEHTMQSVINMALDQTVKKDGRKIRSTAVFKAKALSTPVCLACF